MACYQEDPKEDPLWLAALWDAQTANFFPGQDWLHEIAEDGTRPSCWDPPIQKEAAVCLEGLLNMSSYYTRQQAQSPESSVPFGEAFHFRTSVMTEWCRRVVSGAMPHGALLAHTRLAGQVVTQQDGYSVPAHDVDWQQHGREGVKAVRAILLDLGFYPKMVESVEGLAPPPVPSLAERNQATKRAGFAAVDWAALEVIRGVELWIDDEHTLQNHTWQVVRGGPAVSDLQCPVSPGELLPGEYNITYFQQAKGHWFWAMYKDEATGQLTVKWVRGRCPTGDKRWPQEQHQ